MLSRCRFRNCHFYGVDFVGTNLKKCDFSGSRFVKCVLVGARTTGSNFKGATFENCTFVNQSFENSKNFTHPSFYSLQHPSQVGGPSLRMLFEKLEDFISGRSKYARLIKLKGGKANNLTLYLLTRRYSESVLEQKLRGYIEDENRKPYPGKTFSYTAFEKFIDSI